MLLGQFSATFEYPPGAQHANADDRSRQCGQCLRPDCLVSSPEGDAGDSGSTSAFLDQHFASSAMVDSDLMPICCLNYPEKRGSRPLISTKSRRWAVRSYGPGSYNLEIWKLNRKVVYGVAGYRRRRHRS